MSTINNFDNYEMNRGVDLLIRNRRKKKVSPEVECKKFSFGKIFSFFGREFNFLIELSVKRK